MKQIDREYCASSFLMYRTIADEEKEFSEKYPFKRYGVQKQRTAVHSSEELETALREKVEKACKEHKVALALSGGIDSAILAKFLPKGTPAYTFKCVVPGQKVTDETEAAARYAAECGLEHRVIEIYWEDFEQYIDEIMRHKGGPVHSIEVQFYKAALTAKADGMDALIFGETADALYGGLNGLLGKDWLLGEFVERYSYVMPWKVLKKWSFPLERYYLYEKDGHIDPHEFISNAFYEESVSSYFDACDLAGITTLCPFAETYMDIPIDYERIRNGENKYLVREVFNRLYPGFQVPPKTPMPRPMNEWFKEWAGPTRPEFWPHCTDNMTGDQKWLVWCLERFLNMLDKEDKKS